MIIHGAGMYYFMSAPSWHDSSHATVAATIAAPLFVDKRRLNNKNKT